MSPLQDTFRAARRASIDTRNSGRVGGTSEAGVACAKASTAPDWDRILITKVADGDKAAMRKLYETHAAAVWRFVSVRSRDQFEVADVVQETMLCVWRDAASYKGQGSVRSWILTLARNKAVDHVRKQANTDVCEPDERIATDEPHADDVIAAIEDAHRLNACVEKLPPQQRAVIHLAFFEDLSYAEISAIEGIPEGTVKTRVFHAKKSLMRHLAKSPAPLNSMPKRASCA